jgi:hypothetical protein
MLSFAGNVGSIKLRFNRMVTVLVKQSPLYADINVSEVVSSNFNLLVIAKYGLLLFNKVCFHLASSTLFLTVKILEGFKYLLHPIIGQ